MKCASGSPYSNSMIVLMVFLMASSLLRAESLKPNVLLIIADDLGYADVGVQGCEDIPTPNLDALAASGIRFTDAYVTGPVCSPTRAALLTGRHQARDGVPDWVKPGAPGLDTKVPTLASYLREAGYRTSLIGKWHLGLSDEEHPMARGFDEFFGFLGGGRSYYIGPGEGKGAEARPGTALLRGREEVGGDGYLTYVFADEANAFIRRQTEAAQPFFLVLSFNAVHTPLMGPKEIPEQFASITNDSRRTYAAMTWAMDKAIGDVLETLRVTGIADNTLVCFFSDNGGPITRNSPNASSNHPLRGGKGEVWEGGIRVPFFLAWPGRLERGATFPHPITQMDFTATVLGLAGVTPDAAWPLDGVDLWPHLTGSSSNNPPHDTLCWSYEHRQWAVREGSWKLVAVGANPKARVRPQLYDLVSDMTESRNLVYEHPDVAARLTSKLEAWCRDVGVNQPLFGAEGN